MHIAVIGSGYVGLVAGACFAEIGHQVTLVDNDPVKLAALRNGQVPIFEEHLPELLSKFKGTNQIEYTDSIANAVRDSSVIFIAVGTPRREDGEANLVYIETVAREIAHYVDDYKVVVEKSTVPVLTHDRIREVMLLNGAELGSFDVVSNPEFLREGTAVEDFLYADRIVVGADTQRSAKLLAEIYAPLTSGAYAARPDRVPTRKGDASVPPLIFTSAKSAELIKHASNAFLATKISFINAVANLCEAVGADVQEVCAGVGSDRRIGSLFLSPGVGYGGSCFPKDLAAFHSVARECGVDFSLLEQVIKINEQQRARFVRKIRQALWNLSGKRIAALGLSFKGGTDDIRESPAIAIIRSLVADGANIVCFDPAATERAKEELGDSVEYADSLYAACEQAEAVLILTDWPEFAQIDLKRLKKALKYPIVIDGRNLYSRLTMEENEICYHSIGRRSVQPTVHANGKTAIHHD